MVRGPSPERAGTTRLRRFPTFLGSNWNRGFDWKRPPVYRLPIAVRTQQAAILAWFAIATSFPAHHAHWTEQQLIRRLFLLATQCRIQRLDRRLELAECFQMRRHSLLPGRELLGQSARLLLPH